MKTNKIPRADNIDILKACCAFLVICIHAPFLGAFGEYFTVLARSAVPIFFMITGYFYSDTVQKNRERKQIKKIFVLTVEANLIFLLWDLFMWIICEKNVAVFFQNTFTIKNLVKFFFLNESPLSGHLWYLGAILYVLVIVLVADKFKGRKLLYYITPVLLLGDLLLGKYSIIVFHKEFPYIIVRNFLFVGVPYFCIGCLIRELNEKGNLSRHEKILVPLILLFFMTSLFEHFILVKLNMNATRDHYISTTFLAISIFIYTLLNRGQTKLLLNPMAMIGKRYSTGLYIIHPIFIEVLDVAAGNIGILGGVYRYIAPIIVYISTLCFLIITDNIKKIKT